LVSNFGGLADAEKLKIKSGDMSKCPKRQVLPQMTQNLTKSDIKAGFVNNLCA